jgi:DNA polymerase mu
MPYSDYAALNGLHVETAHNRPDTDGGESAPSSPHPVPSSSRHPISAPISPAVLPKNSKLSYKARFCCARASPLVCPNQELAEQFDAVRRSRALEGEDISALTYARAVAVCEPSVSIFMSNCIIIPISCRWLKVLMVACQFAKNIRSNFTSVSISHHGA